MTTIAFKDGVMAADTLVTSADVRRGSVRKIQRLDDGTLFGISGHSGFHTFVAEWIAAGCKWSARPKIPEGTNLHILVAKTSGSILSINQTFVATEIETDFVAIGSGNEFAMGAMAMGASARDAVLVAARFDVFTGGNIDVFRLGPPLQPKKRIPFPPDGEAAFS